MAWTAAIASALTALRQHEDGVEASAGRQLAALEAECLEYRGYLEEECR